jgi:hypothetical protein
VIAVMGLLSSAVRADEKQALVLDPVEAREAEIDRAVGIGLFVGGLLVVGAAQAVTGAAAAATFDGDGTVDGAQRAQTLTFGAAIGTAAGVAMLAAGLAVWARSNRRRTRLEAGALHF